MGKWMAVLVCAGLLLPYGTALAITGNIHGAQFGREKEKNEAGNYRILLEHSDSGAKGSWLSLEQYLPCVLAMEISPDSEMEALKAQAVIARTYLRQKMELTAQDGEIREIEESELNLKPKPREELRKLWGTDRFLEKYSRLEEAAAQTTGIVMTCKGELITPLFCRVSCGSTRNGDKDHPYLSSVSCPDDEKAENFISYHSFSGEEAAKALNGLPSGEKEEQRQIRGEAFPSKVQIVKRDASGYVEEIQIDGVSFTGEEAAQALGLPSSCFFTEPQEQGISVTVKGDGHGYGLSQYEAQAKALEGWDFKEILEYFYNDIEFFTE